jgi:hypothetical protein
MGMDLWWRPRKGGVWDQAGNRRKEGRKQAESAGGYVLFGILSAVLLLSQNKSYNKNWLSSLKILLFSKLIVHYTLPKSTCIFFTLSTRFGEALNN